MTLDFIVREVIERAVREALAGPLEGAGSSIDRCTLLTVQETCQRLGLTRPMVQKLYGLHPHLVVHFGTAVRISATELAALLERNPKPLEGPCTCRAAEMLGQRRAGQPNTPR